MTKLLAVMLLSFGFAGSAVAATVVKTYTDGTKSYTCIDKNGALYCGNWNVVK